MFLLSLEELALKLSVPSAFIKELIDQKIITPYGGRARLGEPRFSTKSLAELREKLRNHISQS